MAVKLTHFLAKLSTEPDEYARFVKDQAGYTKKAGLSKAHQELIKSMDAKKITAAAFEEQDGPLHALCICTLVIGAQDPAP